MKWAHHPVADLFPMDEDGIEALALDIKAQGQHIPIVLDDQGRILDGRRRQAACQRAGVEPEVVTYEGDSPDLFALSVNAQRRNHTKGQLAVLGALLDSNNEGTTQQATADALGLSQTHIAQARQIVEFAPHAADLVIAGKRTFDSALKESQDEKHKQQTLAEKVAKIRVIDSTVADRIGNGLTLDQAEGIAVIIKTGDEDHDADLIAKIESGDLAPREAGAVLKEREASRAESARRFGEGLRDGLQVLVELVGSDEYRGRWLPPALELIGDDAHPFKITNDVLDQAIAAIQIIQQEHYS